ncbi:MAG: pyruvate kinase [Euryarchaeota archaeon]|nr:pyruvate kinase [Euryarchaeota archaeon]
MSRARVIATIGPACDNDETIQTMIEEGLDIARLNYSHGDFPSKKITYDRLRKFEKKAEKHIGILADLPGPKLRLGRFEGAVPLIGGETVNLCCGVEEGTEGGLPVPWGGLSKDLRDGDPILLADGLVRLEVLSSPEKENQVVTCKIIDGGKITQRKGINVPGTLVNLPAVGPYDKKCLSHALELGVDFVAVSYVRTPEDLLPAREMIKEAGVHTWIIAKIEHPSALNHLEEIVALSDVIMVARGDLGVEIPLEQVPAAQERVILTCLQRGVPVIVATQMLESMVENPRPTRAEVSDVATAIRQGANAVMLSGETAGGNYPLESLKTMVKISNEVTKAISDLPPPPALAEFLSTRAIAQSAVQLAKEIEADHIIVATEHANAAKLVAAFRPNIPVTAMTNRVRACRRTSILPGINAIVVEQQNRSRDTIALATSELWKGGHLNTGDTVVSISGSPQAITGQTSTIRVLDIGKDGRVDNLN